MEILLKANHFRGTAFTDCENCAIARAAKEQNLGHDIVEGVNEIYIDKKRYDHTMYGLDEFLKDKELAVLMDYSPEIGIRKIKLEGYDSSRMEKNLQPAGDSYECLV